MPEVLLYILQSPELEELRIPKLVKSSFVYDIVVVNEVSYFKGHKQSFLLGSSYCFGNGTFIKKKYKIILLIINKLQNYIQEEKPIITASSMRQCH